MIDIHVDSTSINKYLLGLARDEMPFAGARALTWTAQDIQKQVQREMPQRFILRNSFVLKGVRITPAKKVNLESHVYSKDDFMALQETGGAKVPKGKSIAIPTNNVGTNKRNIIPKAQRPRRLLERQGYFKGTVKGVYGLWLRPSNKERRAAYREGAVAGAKLIFAFRPSAQIDPRFGFEETAKEVAAQRMQRNFEVSIKDALR